MWNFIKRIFIWWQDCTIATQLATIIRGKKVGEDDQGNVYYQAKGGKKRWVIYNGRADASRVPPEWHRWLHKTTDDPPNIVPLKTKEWEKPHRPNVTGQPGAYFPPGSLSNQAKRPRATGDYEPWTPE